MTLHIYSTIVYIAAWSGYRVIRCMGYGPALRRLGMPSLYLRTYPMPLLPLVLALSERLAFLPNGRQGCLRQVAPFCNKKGHLGGGGL